MPWDVVNVDCVEFGLLMCSLSNLWDWKSTAYRRKYGSERGAP